MSTFTGKKWELSDDYGFSAEPNQRELAREIFATVRNLPLICPHGHVDPYLLSDPNARFGSPTELFIIPDHYVFRMFYSQGIALTALGIPTKDGSAVETDHRKIWQTFAEHFYLFRGTPTGLWFADELINLFGVEEKLNRESANRIYDYLTAQLAKPEFQPRALFKRFNIEVLCTTDAPWDSLEPHQSLHSEGYTNILPTFRPDGVVNLDHPFWRHNLLNLAETCHREISSYASLMQCLAERRAFFKTMGATATDHAALTAYTEKLTEQEAEAIFSRALKGQLEKADATRFSGHMLIEMARMSLEDGLVMQLHVGSYRNHNPELFNRFGTDKGADIPVTTEWTHNLKPLLDLYGNNRDLTLILFCLDESTYSRELAPMAGHYPALRLGPPWWFHDSVKGMSRYLEQIMETAGIYNTVGFNDDTRAFASIPARHSVWRRVTCNWLAGLVLQGLIDREDAFAMAQDLAYKLAKSAYKL